MTQTLKDAFQNPKVQKLYKGYNTFMNTKANLFSDDASEFISNCKWVPDVVKDNYQAMYEAAMGATAGLIGGAGLTFALRHQNLVNKGIDLGITAVKNVGDLVNEKIDDVVEQHRMKNDDDIKQQRGYENIVKYDNPSSENEVSMEW